MNNTNNNVVSINDSEEKQNNIHSYIESMNLMMQNLTEDSKDGSKPKPDSSLINLCLKEFIHKTPQSEFEADSEEAKYQIREYTQQAVNIVLALSSQEDKQPLRNMLQSLSEVYPRIQEDVIKTLLKITDYSDIPAYMAICLKMSKDLNNTENTKHKNKINSIENTDKKVKISDSEEARTYIIMMESLLVKYPGQFREKINYFSDMVGSPLPTISSDVNLKIEQIIPFDKNFVPKKNRSRVVSLESVNKKAS
jgi:hypothetical protein